MATQTQLASRLRGAASAINTAAIGLRDGNITFEQFQQNTDFVIDALVHHAEPLLPVAAEHPQAHWFGPYRKCFGADGVVVLAWWLGALAATDIRERHGSYPFLAITGEPGAGKSSLLEFLWKLLGRDGYEGFDPSRSSLAARSRYFHQEINLPIVLIESDRDEHPSRRYDFDELKTAYNGRAERMTGIKPNDDAYEPTFHGAICISQCDPSELSHAIRTRMVLLTLSRSSHNCFTRAAAEILERMPVREVGDFQRYATEHKGQVLDILDSQKMRHENELMTRYRISPRLAKNYAQLMVLVDALATLLPVTEEMQAQAHERLIECAVKAHEDIEAGDD